MQAGVAWKHIFQASYSPFTRTSAYIFPEAAPTQIAPEFVITNAYTHSVDAMPPLARISGGTALFLSAIRWPIILLVFFFFSYHESARAERQ